MARNPDELRRSLDRYLGPDFRGRLRAKGIARGMVWRDGVVPEGSPSFVDTLSADLLDFGYAVLVLALELRDANLTRTKRRFETKDAFVVAAEAIESAVRRGDPSDGDQGRHLVVGAAAFHLAGYAARSYSMLPPAALDKNLATSERALAFLLRRDILALRELILSWLGQAEHSDEAVAQRLANADDEFGPEDAVVLALTTTYFRALGLADTALLTGEPGRYEAAIAALAKLIAAAGDVGNVPVWWVATLTIHLLRDLWDQCLHIQLPGGEGPSGDMLNRWTDLRRDFIAQLAVRRPPHIDLWPSQLEAAKRSVDTTDDLVIALPTSAGKTKIAELCILRTLAGKKRVVYVTPLRALSAQVERVLARTFVPLGAAVTSLYGAIGTSSVDSQTLLDADVVVATPEKLDFALRQDVHVLDDVGLVVFDEGHMIGLGSREIRYEVLIQRLLRRGDAGTRRIVCLSAMFNPQDAYFKDFAAWLRNDADGEPIHVEWRPTRRRLALLDWFARSGTARLSFLEGEEAYVTRFVELQPPRGEEKLPSPPRKLSFALLRQTPSRATEMLSSSILLSAARLTRSSASSHRLGSKGISRTSKPPTPPSWRRRWPSGASGSVRSTRLSRRSSWASAPTMVQCRAPSKARSRICWSESAWQLLSHRLRWPRGSTSRAAFLCFGHSRASTRKRSGTPRFRLLNSRMSSAEQAVPMWTSMALWCYPVSRRGTGASRDTSSSKI